MMQRHSDWAKRLEAYLRENARREFVYGAWDCCLFVAGAVEAMTGVDPAASFRGQYSTHAIGVIALNFAGYIEGVCAAHGMPEVSVKMARRGDVVEIKDDAPAPLMGIVALNGREVFVLGEEGLRTIPLGMAERAWRV